MAARWRGKDGDLNAGNSDFLTQNTPNELVLSRRDVEMDTQSCMDHSILAIFEDSTVASEDKSGAEEESATLLSALTEMLDSVEDDDGTPFDTLPDTKLLTHPECRDDSVKTEAEVEVFTSTSLVNLVRIMHPYCMRLHVEEEGDKPRRKDTLFSQEEVWKYERPTEESDEEINVVSDDEVTLQETKEEGKGRNLVIMGNS
ncbi:hypothetical protein GBF38_022472 [Nibea albiflora]|uniref:Uncharacterized protein n=1 Tax=Nibea albiflora TaxID=240163 RepID=A0ACB7FL26_NIBAL|nr:hypothetical protein GBF38_022472 [Nibea albiflora]